MDTQDAVERDRREQARHRFTVLGVFPTGHGIDPVTVGPAELHSTMDHIERCGARPVVVDYVKLADAEPVAEPDAESVTVDEPIGVKPEDQAIATPIVDMATLADLVTADIKAGNLGDAMKMIAQAQSWLPSQPSPRFELLP